MTRSVRYLICMLILAMDVSAGILGIQAEIAENKMKHFKEGIFECRVPSYKAFKCGVAACILLALAHATANFLGGCLCIVSRQDLERSSPNKQLAVASLIFSWIILAVGFSLLVVGTMANSRSRKYCVISHHRVLSMGGILCFIHSLFIIAYYTSATASAREQTNTSHA